MVRAPRFCCLTSSSGWVCGVVFTLCIASTVILLYIFSISSTHNNNPQTQQKRQTQEVPPETPGDIFLADVQKGAKDIRAIGHAYDFVAQYINNGGNIYVISDFIEQHDKLAFLSEARHIYPNVFDLIKKRRLPFTYSDDGFLAYLAYLEILEQNGYDDITIQGELALQYAKNAYYMQMIQNDKTEGRSLNYPDYSEEQIGTMLAKAKIYAQKADNITARILADPITHITSRQSLHGLVQYATSLRFLEKQRTTFLLKHDPETVFAFAFNYAKMGRLPDSYLLIAYTDAASQLLTSNPDPEKMRESLQPLLETGKTVRSVPFVKKILASRYETSPYRMRDLLLTGPTIVKELARRVPDFRTWLMENGWTERDFYPEN